MKRVVISDSEKVKLKDVDENKIYMFKDAADNWYKIQKQTHDKYASFKLTNSYQTYTGASSSLKREIEKQINFNIEVFEFCTIADMVKHLSDWLES